jgi:tetratricopeptide (TPR) repeat protein
MSSQPPENPEQSSALIPAPSTAVLQQHAESGLALVRDVLREGDAEYWFELGKVAHRDAQWDLAIHHFTKAIDLQPDWAEARAQRRRSKITLDEYADAMAHCEKALTLNPKDPVAYSNRGYAKSHWGDNVGAIADYDRAIELDPKLAHVYNNRGVSKSNLGDNVGAIADYDRAIEIDPILSTAYHNRSNAKIDLGDNVGAEADLAEGIFAQEAEHEMERIAKQQAS